MKFFTVFITAFAVLAFAITVQQSFAQSTRWSTIEYQHSSGPVSPEYQYEYKVVINEDGSSTFSYSDMNRKFDREFRIPSGKKGMKKLKKALKKSMIFDVTPDEMKSSEKMIGGKENKLTVTLWQDPMLDQMPEKIEVPSQVKDEFKNGIDNLYSKIIELVPSEYRKETGLFK